jgi:hypothetical protein
MLSFKGEKNLPHYSLVYYSEQYYYFFNYALQPLRLIVQSELDVPTFATRRLHASLRESTQWWKVELWARNVWEFCLNADLLVTFRDLLHDVKLQHGTDGFTSPPKEGTLRNFFCPKNPMATAGCEPTNLGTEGQHATSRLPKPHSEHYL